jgi:hypothetical protein
MGTTFSLDFFIIEIVATVANEKLHHFGGLGATT